MSATARRVLFHGVGQPFELRVGPVPVPSGAEILVHVTACTLCGSDLHTHSGRRNVAVPTVLGHEIIGTIEAFGPDAVRDDIAGQSLNIGDRVTWAIVANCQHCFYCKRDLPQKCERGLKYGHEVDGAGLEYTGGLAEVCLLAAGSAVLRIPDSLSDEVACPANCATATVAAMMEAAGDLTAQTVLVLGAGLLGLTACAMARFHGATAVICCDVNAERRQRALAFGASHHCAPDAMPDMIAEITAKRGVDVVFELTGSEKAFEAAFPLVRLGGTLVLAGSVFPAPPVPLLLERVVRRNLTLRGIHNYAPHHLRQAVEFLETAPHFPFASLMAKWFPLAQTQQAFEFAHASQAFRVGIRM